MEQENVSSARDAPKSLCNDLYVAALTKDQEAEMMFNLVNFFETLIAMDRQHQEWLKNQTDQQKEQV